MTALGRKQPFKPARKSQPSVQPYPIWGVTQDSNDTVRLGQLERLFCSIVSGCCGAESVAGLSRIRRGRIYGPLIKNQRIGFLPQYSGISHNDPRVDPPRAEASSPNPSNAPGNASLGHRLLDGQ